MDTKRVRRGGIAAALAAGALLLSACTPSAPAEGPERVWVRAITGDPMTTMLNAQFTPGGLRETFSAQIFDPLIFISDAYELSPALAEEYELSDDGLTLTLTIRDGVTWHDGEPFTADDVKFNIDEIFPLTLNGGQLAERIESTEIVDESTVVVTLSEVFSPILEAVATQYILPKHIYEGTDYITNEANKYPIGTGPMMYRSYTSGQEVVLEKNPDFWGGEVQVDKAVFTMIPDGNSRAAVLYAGRLDEAVLDVPQLSRLGEVPNTKLINVGFPEVVTMMYNAARGPLQDVDVRAAVFAAVDRDAIAEVALAGLGAPANTFWPEGVSSVNTDVNFDEDFPRDLDAINAALDAAGYPRGADGTRFTLVLRNIDPLTETIAIGELITSQLAEVGVTVQQVGSGGAEFTQKVYKESDFDLALLSTRLGAEPSLGITRWYVCNPERNSASNPSGVCDERMDELAEEAVSTVDQEERDAIYREMQDRAAELVIHTPLAWFNRSDPVINTTNWEGVDVPTEHTQRKPWLTMSPVG